MTDTALVKCSCYEVDKPQSDYWKKSTGRTGWSNICKVCTEDYRRTRRKKNPEIFLNQSYKDRFGITLDEYKAMLLQQRGICAICGKPETATYRGKIRALSVDHNHVSGNIRGLLCDNCNHVLGAAKDDTGILDAAIRYLEFYRNL